MNQARNGSRTSEPGITQTNKYGLTEDAERITLRRCARSVVVQAPRWRWRINQTMEPFMVASSLRKRVFSRVLPARKEQNHSGARSIRRWKAVVEFGSKASAGGCRSTAIKEWPDSEGEHAPMAALASGVTRPSARAGRLLRLRAPSCRRHLVRARPVRCPRTGPAKRCRPAQKSKWRWACCRRRADRPA